MYICSVCGQEVTDARNYEERTRQEMEEKKLCFSCHFWWGLAHTRLPEGTTRVIVGNDHMIAYPWEKHPDEMRGFGGQAFYFRMSDGRIIRSNNVWHQGTIPEQFREVFPPNAIAITKEEYDRAQPVTISPGDVDPGERPVDLLIGAKRQVAVVTATCAICGGPATNFRDQLSRKEFGISGMCQKCQDNFFGR